METVPLVVVPFRAPTSGMCLFIYLFLIYLLIYLTKSRQATYQVWLHIIEAYKRRQSRSQLSSHCSILSTNPFNVWSKMAAIV